MERTVPISAGHAEWKKKQRLRLGLIRAAIILLCAAVAVIGLMLLIFPTLRVKEIVVKGNSVTSTADILAAAGVSVGDEIFTVNQMQVVDRLANKFPTMQKIRVTRGLSKITIEVTEQGVGYIAYAGYWFLLDRDLKVLSMSGAQEDYAAYPRLVLPTVVKLSVGSRVQLREDDIGRDYIEELFDLLSCEGLMSHVTYIDVSEKYHISYILEDRIRVVLGKLSDVDLKLEMTEQILGARFENDSPYAIVDVSDLKKTTYRGMQSAELLLSY